MCCTLLLLVTTVFIFIANVNTSVVMQSGVYRFFIIDFSHVGNTFISLLVKMYLEVVRLIYREGVGRKQGERHLGRLSLAE